MDICKQTLAANHSRVPNRLAGEKWNILLVTGANEKVATGTRN